MLRLHCAHPWIGTPLAQVSRSGARERWRHEFLPVAFGVRNLDRWLSGQKQQTVNLPALAAYGGSNPPLSTISKFETRKWKLEASRHEAAAGEFRISGFDCRDVVEAWGGINSVVESQPSKLLVAGSIPVSRSKEQWSVFSG